MPKKQIQFRAGELADAYALKTLYDYLAPKNNELDIFFWETPDFYKSEGILAKRRQNYALNAKTDLYVGCYSDINNGFSKDLSAINPDAKHLGIDISLLKNAVIPMTRSQKLRLREKYGINSEHPVVVVGYSDRAVNVLEKILGRLGGCANFYLVSVLHLNLGVPREMLKRIHCIQGYGLLKDYYAMADMVLNGDNLFLKTAGMHMHNFVEATEGGPLFIITPPNTSQYGYNEMVSSKVIRAFNDFEELVKEALGYITNFRNNTRHVAARNKHLRKTRGEYLPVIREYIRYMAGFGRTRPESGLRCWQPDINKLRIRHPETVW